MGATSQETPVTPAALPVTGPAFSAAVIALSGAPGPVSVAFSAKAAGMQMS